MLMLCIIKNMKTLISACTIFIFSLSASAASLPLPARFGMRCAEILTHSSVYPKFYQELYFAKEARVKGRATGAHYHSAMESQFFSLDQIESNQIAALKKLLIHAQTNIPFYQKHF